MEKQSPSRLVPVQPPPRISLALTPEEEERKLIIAEYITKFAIIAGNRGLTESFFQIYEEALSDLSPSRLRAGMQKWLREGDRMPWPGDIREAAEL